MGEGARAAEADRRAQLRFKREVCHPKAVCAVCGKKGRPTDPLEAHHVTAAQTVKRFVKALGLEPKDARERLRRLLWEPRNGMAVHQSEHTAHTKAYRRIPLRCVTLKHRQFAREVEAEHLIDRYYEVS